MKTHTIFHYSCVKYYETRLKHQLNSWPKRLPSTFESIPMTGSGKDQYDGDILRLDVKDDYKSLVYKTKKMFEWYLDNCSTEWIIKVDDDVWLSDAGIETLQNDKSPYSGSYLLQYKKIHIIAGPLYKIHRDYLEKLTDIVSNKIVNKSSEDAHVGVALSNLGVVPVGLFPSNKRCLWPTFKKTSETQFGLCNSTSKSLQDMYEFFDSTKSYGYAKKPCCGGGPKKIASPPKIQEVKIQEVKIEKPAPKYGAKRKKYPRR